MNESRIGLSRIDVVLIRRTITMLVIGTVISACIARGQSTDTAFNVPAQTDRGESELASPEQLFNATPHLVRQGAVELRLQVSHDAAGVAEPIEVELAVDAPQHSKVAMPIIGTSLGSFEVTDQRRVSDLPINGDPDKRRWILRISIESIESGQLELPAFEVAYRLPQDPVTNGSAQSIRSRPLAIEIVSLLNAEQDPRAFRDIKGPVVSDTLPDVPDRRAWLVAGSLLAVIASVGGFFWWRRRPATIPHQLACEQIASLEALDKSGDLLPGDLYTELSMVLRVFLERELGLSATFLSSRELQDEMVSRACPPALIARLTQFLSEADEVKFSGRSTPRHSPAVPPTVSAREIVDQVRGMSDASNGGA